MNCENTVDIDNFINDIIECSNIKQNGNPECIRRLIFIKEDTKVTLKTLEGYFKRLLKKFKSQKNANQTNVSNKIKRIDTGINTLISFYGASQPGNTRKDRIEEIFYAFTEIAKIHKSIGPTDFGKICHGFFNYYFKKYLKRVIAALMLLLITIPMIFWGTIEAYTGLITKGKELFTNNSKEQSLPGSKK